MSTNMESEWRKYRDHCYPGGIDGIQASECRQAFFAGALALSALMMSTPDGPGEDNAVAKIMAEVEEVCRLRGIQLGAAN